MSAPGGIRRNFSNFKGLNQGADDLTRPVEFADEATNVEVTRKGAIIKRRGGKPESRTIENIGDGIYTHHFSKANDIEFTGYKFGGAAAFVPYVNPDTGVGGNNWSGTASNVLADNGVPIEVSTPTGVYVSDYIVVTDFGFNVPENAEITGFSVEVEIATNSATLASVAPRISITTNGGSTFLADTYIQPYPESYQSSTTAIKFRQHTPNILYGAQNITASDVNASNFGFGIRLSWGGSSDTFIKQIDYILCGVHYRTRDLNEREETLFAIGDQLYKKAAGTFAITYSGSNTATLDILPEPTTDTITVDIKENGSSISGFPKAYAPTTSIGTMYEDINGLADYSVVATPIARVNGNQTNVNDVTVDASPMTFQRNTRVGFAHSTLGFDVWRWAIDVASTTITVDTRVSVSDNAWLGIGYEQVQSLPQTQGLALTSGTSVSIDVPYWEGVSNVASTEGYARQQDNLPTAAGAWNEQPFKSVLEQDNANSANVSFVTSRDNLYFAMPFFLNDGVPDAPYLEGQPKPNLQNTGLWKYDGLDCYLAGLPAMTAPLYVQQTSLLAGNGLELNSTYKYRFQYVHIDYRGNEVAGPLTDEVTGVTTSDSNMQIIWASSINADGSEYFLGNGLRPFAAPFPVREASIDTSVGTQTDTATIVVYEYHNIIAGLKVSIWHNGLKRFVDRTVVSTTATSITFDEPITWDPAISPLYSHYIVTPLRMRVWRTVANGSLFYKAFDAPGVRAIGGATAGYHRLGDGLPDSQLGEPLIESDRRPSLFPKLKYLANHQGLIVGSGNPDDPEAVYFEDIISIESSPAASSNFRISGSGSSGAVTALASDNDDMLAVFKEDNYFNVVGDLDSLSFQVLEVSKNEFGCPSHAALVKMDNVLVFPSNNGFKAVSGGQLVADFRDRLIDDLTDNFYVQINNQSIKTENEDRFVVARATAIYDPSTRQYICYIPCESGTPGYLQDRTVNDNSRVFVYNRGRDSIVKWALPVSMNMAGGMAIHKDNLYWCARTYDGTRRGQVFHRRQTGTTYDYLDNLDAISMTLRMTWDSMEAPSDYFNAIFLKLFQFAPEQYVGAFDLSVKEYRSYDESTIYTNANRTFSTSTERQKRIKLKSGRASAISVSFTNDTAMEKPVLTGYEYEVRNPYLPRIKAGRNG